MRRSSTRLAVLLVALSWMTSLAVAQQTDEREKTERVGDVLAALALKPGMHVADIGAGDGFYTLKIAAAIAPGRVTGGDINQKALDPTYSPPPPEGFISPMTWGVEDNVLERLGAAGVPAERVSFEKETYTFNAAMSPTAYVAEFRGYYGPTMNAFAAAEQSGKAADLQRELEELFERQNRSGGTNATSIPATFLRITVRV